MKLKKEKQLSSHAVNILINHAIFQFGGSLSIIFVNLYLWRLTNSLWVNGLYNLIAILAQAATTISIGKMSKKKGRTTIYRYGIFMTAIFYLFIVIVQEEIVTYFYLFALLRGIAQGLYWVVYFTIVHEFSSDENRHRYLGWNQMVMSSANLIAPALAGYIIALYNGLAGYSFVFSIAFLMFFIATIGTFILFMATLNIFKPLQANAFAAYYFQWIDRIPLGAEFRVESVVLRETIINIGRGGLGIIVFMLFSNGIDTNTVAYVIVLAMLIQFILPIITKLKEEV
ncbi:MFS transporter [Gracilibacillus boraciitolerans]|nr:MFS transporter [Gracilibacillus boraciitolerans]